MNQKKSDNIKTMLLLLLLIILTEISDRFPWWGFVVPVIILGTIITLKKWKVSSFAIGFISGFIIWFGANLYFDMTLRNLILSKMGYLFSVPKVVVLLFSGIIGGLLTGLALYTGKSIVHKESSELSL